MTGKTNTGDWETNPVDWTSELWWLEKQILRTGKRILCIGKANTGDWKTNPGDWNNGSCELEKRILVTVVQPCNQTTNMFNNIIADRFVMPTLLSLRAGMHSLMFDTFCTVMQKSLAVRQQAFTFRTCKNSPPQ